MTGTLAPYAFDSGVYGDHVTDRASGGVVTAVRPDSPAYDAGIEPGMVVTCIAGDPLRDMIDWLWLADGDAIELEVFDPRDGALDSCVLERLPGEDWGITFGDAVFDGMRTCVNGCVFCFMTMLPDHMRSSLTVRDDDYRLSFLQGNFVTLTNLSDDEVDRIISCRLSPMNVSLHAVTPAVRRRLMGKNAARGIEVLERLIAADIEIHAQIVLCPDLNDGEELDRTLSWCEARPAITSLGIVPLGYTRFQTRFTSSFSDDPARARRVIEQVRPFQERARARCGATVFQLSDEFYLDAHLSVPAAESYDGYPQFYDGIGMIRSYLDDTASLVAEAGRLEAVAAALGQRGLQLYVVSGTAAAPTVAGFVERPPLSGRVLAIENRYFGGNVDVTGLICGVDLIEQLPAELTGVMLILPSVMFNADGLTLDGYHEQQLIDIAAQRGATTHIASTQPYELIGYLEGLLGA